MVSPPASLPSPAPSAASSHHQSFSALSSQPRAPSVASISSHSHSAYFPPLKSPHGPPNGHFSVPDAQFHEDQATPQPQQQHPFPPPPFTPSHHPSDSMSSMSGFGRGTGGAGPMDGQYPGQAWNGGEAWQGPSGGSLPPPSAFYRGPPNGEHRGGPLMGPPPIPHGLPGDGRYPSVERSKDRRGRRGGRDRDGRDAREREDSERERPESRQRGGREDRENGEDDVISTIFVVGFPDDMSVSNHA